MGRIFAPCAGEGIRPWGEYLPHVLERVFVQGTNTCPMFWGGYSSMGRILAPCFGEGIRPPDGYLPHVLERVFVHGTNTCLTNRTRSQRIRIPIRIRVRVGCAEFVSLHSEISLREMRESFVGAPLPHSCHITIRKKTTARLKASAKPVQVRPQRRHHRRR